MTKRHANVLYGEPRGMKMQIMPHNPNTRSGSVGIRECWMRCEVVGVEDGWCWYLSPLLPPSIGLRRRHLLFCHQAQTRINTPPLSANLHLQSFQTRWGGITREDL